MKDSGLSALFRATDAHRGPASGEEAAGDGSVPAESPGADSRAVQAAEGAAAGSGAGQGAAVQSAAPSAPSAAPSKWGVSAPVIETGRRSLIQPSRSFPAVIRVVGVGGAGTNAINRMLEAGLEGIEFIAINTDVQALAGCEADHKLRIGRELTKGLGGGAYHKIGREAAMGAYDDIKSMLKGSDMVFITAGEGGGTGTGAAPVVAEIAKSLGALTIGVVSRPFAFEGRRRAQQALDGVRTLRRRADTVIVVPNDKLLEVADRGTSMLAALRLADDVLRQGVQGICDLVMMPGLINLDLADVRTIMTGAGTAHMGIGKARGEARAQKAAEAAVHSSLLETSIDGARGILLNISGGSDLSLFEVNEVASIVNAAADPDANIIFGAVVDPTLGDSIWVTVVATGFDNTGEEALAEQLESGQKLPSASEQAADRDHRAAGEPRPAEEPRREAPREPAPPEEKKGDDLEVPSFLRFFNR
jgi:cell division protein FtsZ